MLKEQIEVLALGACGGNIGMKFFEYGYRVAFINSSLEDLAVIKAPIKIHIKGGEGCAKNRRIIKELAVNSIEDIIRDITTAITAKYIIIPVGIGGGSGSGIAPSLISFLSSMGHVCIPVLVFPSKHESAKTCENAWNFMAEISQIKNIGSMFLLDNNSNEDKFAINNKFVKDFDSFVNIHNESAISNMDTREKKLLLETVGVSVIGRVSKSKSSITELIENVVNGVYAPIENKHPKYIGLSTSNQSIKVSDLYSSFGEPYDSFVGYSKSTSIIFLAGLQLPHQRIEEFKNKFERTVNNINNTIIQQPPTIQPLQSLSFSREEFKPATPINPRDILLGLLQ